MNTIQDTGTSLLASLNGTQGATKTTAEDPQDRFLKLLVTQMKNQDPLCPLDNAQVTSQLAQISTVSGIDRLNTTMQTLATGFGASQSLAAANMIGRSVLVPGSTTQLSASGAVLGVDLAQPADKVTITISDSSGRPIHTMDLGPQGAGALAFQWDGATDSGATAVAGPYSFSVNAVVGGQKVDAQPLSMGLVDSVSQGTQGLKLNLGALGAIGLPDVRQIF
jgi:flagellar basal-body rod modification protein FlgD